jgi:hypothetical protein
VFLQLGLSMISGHWSLCCFSSRQAFLRYDASSFWTWRQKQSWTLRQKPHDLCAASLLYLEGGCRCGQQYGLCGSGWLCSCAAATELYHCLSAFPFLCSSCPFLSLCSSCLDSWGCVVLVATCAECLMCYCMTIQCLMLDSNA